MMNLVIKSFDVLIYSPEEEFRSLVSLKNFSILHCSKLIGPAKVKRYHTRVRDQFLPSLQELRIKYCERLTKLFILPPFLTRLRISYGGSIECILGQDDRELETLQHFVSPEKCVGACKRVVSMKISWERCLQMCCLRGSLTLMLWYLSRFWSLTFFEEIGVRSTWRLDRWKSFCSAMVIF